jgi:hypothetical protein
MASTTPVGGYAPGTNDVPGMQGGRDATNGGHRNVAFLDAGACSKMLRALPSMTSFFRNVRKSVSGLQTQSASNTSAIKNLLHSQANLNDQTNQLNYWMRQASPQMDKLNSELVASNDALAALLDSSANNVDAPGMPDSLTLLPSLTVDNLLLYFARPSYAGSTAITGYELVTFTTAGYALAFSNGSAAVQLTESALAAAVGAAPWNTAQADEFYSVYGDELRFVSSGLVTGGAGQGLCVRLRAYNTSGANGANLYSEWSAPTLLVCAAASTAALKPKVEAITAGAAYSLIEWSAPAVRQPDGSVARVGGIHSYMVGGTAVVGSTTVAQVPLASGTTSVTVAACSTADGSSPIATSDAFPVTVPTAMPRPSMSILLIPSGSGVYASLQMNVTDYYSTTSTLYTVSGVDNTDSAYSGTASGTTADPATAADGSMVCTVRFPASGNLRPSSSYTFTATAQHATGTPYTSISTSAQMVTTPSPSRPLVAQVFAPFINGAYTLIVPFTYPAAGSHAAMDVATFNSTTFAVTKQADSSPVTGTLAWNPGTGPADPADSVLNFTPDTPFVGGTTYKLTMLPTVADAEGNLITLDTPASPSRTISFTP